MRMEGNFGKLPQKREIAPSTNLEELRSINRQKLRPQIDEILGQLLASERSEDPEKAGAYSTALVDFDSDDMDIKEHALNYLQQHQIYLMDAVRTILRMGFDNPEEKAVSDEANTRLGVIFEKFAKVMH